MDKKKKKQKKEPKPNLSPKAIRLLEKVRDHILEEPMRFDMSVWARQIPRRDIPDWEPACGTTACIAGWVVLLGAPKVYKELLSEAKTLNGEYYDAAELESVLEQNVDRLFPDLALEDSPPSEVGNLALHLLGLAKLDMLGGLVERVEGLWSRLFIDSDWPEPFRDEFKKSYSRARKARVAARRINFFIKTDATDMARKKDRYAYYEARDEEFARLRAAAKQLRAEANQESY